MHTTPRLFVGVLALTAGMLTGTGAASGDAAYRAPLLLASDGQAVKDRYIVVLKAGVPSSRVTAVRGAAVARGARVHFTYRAALKGFAATLSASMVESLRHDKSVAYVEQDQVVTLADTQISPPLGLDRIDQRALPLSRTYTYDRTGMGVRAYIVDTGLRTSHTQFGGRAVHGYDAIDNTLPADDCNGHGTHVAGTVGATTYGVAKAVTLVGVRVLNCQGTGTSSQVIAGINWVTSDHDPGEPAVANLSFGSPASTALDTAVSNSIADGTTYVVAAGNGNSLGVAVSTCTVSPARVPAAITVSATNSSDAKPSYANTGTCLDLFAPGVQITSTWHTGDTATNTIGGTSMAAPHAAGVAALFLQGTPTATPEVVREHLVATATNGVVSNAGAGSPNRLLFSLGQSGPPTPGGCTGYQQTFSGTLSGTGDYDNHPNGSYYYSPGSGTHVGCLDGPAGVDFDLTLYRWNGYYWATVAQGTTVAPDEKVSYNGAAGYYHWRVFSYNGSGSYTFGMSKP